VLGQLDHPSPCDSRPVRTLAVRDLAATDELRGWREREDRNQREALVR
jgi:hypothetical protein